MRTNILILFLMTTIFMGCRGEVPMQSSTLDKSTTVPQVCYKFDKDYFNSPKDIVINTTTIESEFGVIGIEFGNSKDNYYEHMYECNLDNNNFQCSKQNSIESFQIKIKDEKAYLHVDYMQIPEKSGAILYRLKSKDSSFSDGVKTPCYSSVAPIIDVDDLKKGSKKEKLLQSINIDNVIIYDLDYYKDFVVAVGEDNSQQIRAEQYTNYTFASLIIISNDGGKTWKKVQKKKNTYYNKVLILDNKHIIVTSFTDEVGGTIEVSSDGGLHWSNVLKKKHRIYGDIFVSLKKSDNEIIAIREKGNVLKSLDGGETWSRVEEKSNKNTSLAKRDELAVLAIPEYRVDYQTNNLMVFHQKKFCKCDQFSLPLTYNQSNTKNGILGLFWSFGIESHIDIKSDKELLFFDAKRGEEKIYKRDDSNEHIFINHSASSIKQIKDGYVKECGKSKQYFNKNGFLIKLEYEKNVYILEYKDNKIYKINKLEEGGLSPYISFEYSYEGVNVTFDFANKKTVTFIKNRQGLLSSVVDGNKQVFKYDYTESESINNTKLLLIDDYLEPYFDKTVLKFDKNRVYDYRLIFDDIVKEVSYLHYDKDKEHTCFVSTLTMSIKKGLIEDIENEMDLYTFGYYGKDKKRLLSTQHNNHTFGFDEVGRVNHYANEKKDIFIVYSKFNKVLNSLVNKEGKSYKYKYTYTDDINHKVKTILSPNGSVEILYDERHNVKEMKLDEYYTKYEYDKNDQPIKVILVGIGELITSYDSEGEIEDVKYVPLDKSVSTYQMTEKITHIMELLVQRATAGSIQKYPYWL